MIPFYFLHLWLLTLPIDNSLNYSSDTHPTRALCVSRFLSGTHFSCRFSVSPLLLKFLWHVDKHSQSLLMAFKGLVALIHKRAVFFFFFYTEYRYCYPLSFILHWSRHTTAHILHCIIKMWAVIWSLHCPTN